MAQGMHADLINTLVSKRLDRWRRDISEKRRKCKKHSSKTFSFKTSAQVDGKTKMFHTFSSYFLHFFFQFSPNFPNVKNSNCFHHRSTDVCKHTGKGKTFYSNEFFLCKNTWISCTASASTKETASPVWHTNAFILSGYKGIWCQVSFFVATPERNATATRKEALWWDGFYSDSLKQTVDQLWEHCTVRADPTPAVDTNLFFKDVQYWKLKAKLRTIITT